MHFWLIGLGIWNALITLATFILCMDNGHGKLVVFSAMWLYVTFRDILDDALDINILMEQMKCM